jgi:TorA maturation chaperone TorD
MIPEMTLAAPLAFAGKAFLGSDPEELRSLVVGLVDCPEALLRALQSPAEEIRKEYRRLFLDPDRLLCDPRQSSYQEPPATESISSSASKWYQSEGLEDQLRGAPPDHIGLLLLFASHLVRSNAGAVRRSRFHSEHLAWIPQFCALVAAETRHTFVRELAYWTRSLVEFGI